VVNRDFRKRTERRVEQGMELGGIEIMARCENVD
jgi:hypothetical protein